MNSMKSSMKLLIRHKQIYYIILALHVFFLSMPVSHAGDIVLCYSNTGHIKIELKLSDKCSCSHKNSDNIQENDPCYCVDIPISKEVDEHKTLLNNKTIQSKLQVYIQTNTTNLLNPSYHDGLFTLVNHLHFKSTANESLRTIVLLI